MEKDLPKLRASPLPSAAIRRIGRPQQFSLEHMLEAVRIVGLDDLTLQAVADALEVTPAALYRYVSGKDELIYQFVAYVTAKFPAPTYGGEQWSDWATRFALALLEMYQAVPGLADYSVGETQTSDIVLSRYETSIQAAKLSGFSEVDALYATRAIVEFVAGWVARTQRRAQLERQRGEHPDETLRSHMLTAAAAERYPGFSSALRVERDSASRFRFTLLALIRGLSDEALQKL